MRYYEIFSFSIVVASVFCYVFIWIYVRCSLSNSGGQQAKLFKSLAVMTFIVAGCFGTTYLIAILFAGGENATFVHLYNGIGINIGCSCNYYVLYFMR
ncbi:hypothetical protein AAVH_30613 [Aphelenchoides avenae]|nr:hypothetical protein AAVH_30613 [Aphelenchus avenae]